jgi:sec-independent protein translocase protein TatC
MPRTSDKDLFHESTMSFGEHLDELRGALVKSVLALAIGTCVGLYVADWVVQWIQAPLKSALEEFALDQAIQRFLVRSHEREAAGEHVPAELKDPTYVAKMIREGGMLFGELYIDPAGVLTALREKYPQLPEIELPARNPNLPPLKSDLVRILTWHPVKDDMRVRVVGLSPQEAFLIWIKAGLVTGFILSSPAVFYFLWEFVAAGLYPQEKSYVYIFLPFSLGLFLAGALLTFFFVFPQMLSFFFGFYARIDTDPDQRLSEWLSLVLIMPIGFGLSFQLPLVMLFLERIGIFTTASYLSSWRIAILVMAVIAMVITPTGDPQTMLMLLAPLTVLYFAGILLCKWMPRREGELVRRG